MLVFAVVAWVLVILGVVLGLAWLAGTSGWQGAFRAGRRAHDAGRYGDAERHLLRALDVADKFAADDRRRLATLDLLGQVYLAQGKLDKAESLLRASLSRMRQALA